LNTGSPLKQKIQDELKQAMRAGDKEKVSVIRLLLAAIQNAEIARQAVLSDGDVLGIIAKEVRQREESITAFKEGNRPDLVAIEAAELNHLREYLPPAVDRDEIMALAQKVIAEVGARGPKDKGKVMPRLVSELKGRADGRVINEVVTELLAS
jgi:uncharacterized protein YqeY